MKLDTEYLIKLLTQVISEKYGVNPTAPSLVISWLGTEWYVSIVIYKGYNSNNKQRIAHYQGLDLQKLLIKLSKSLIITHTNNPINTLKDLINKIDDDFICEPF